MFVEKIKSTSLTATQWFHIPRLRTKFELFEVIRSWVSLCYGQTDSQTVSQPRTSYPHWPTESAWVIIIIIIWMCVCMCVCEVSEIVGPSYRVLATTVIQLYWAVAYMTLAGIAYLLRDRFTLHISISAPLALLLLFYWWEWETELSFT